VQPLNDRIQEEKKAASTEGERSLEAVHVLRWKGTLDILTADFSARKLLLTALVIFLSNLHILS